MRIKIRLISFCQSKHDPLAGGYLSHTRIKVFKKVVSLTFFTMDSCESFCAVANSTTSGLNAGSLVLTFDIQAF